MYLLQAGLGFYTKKSGEYLQLKKNTIRIHLNLLNDPPVSFVIAPHRTYYKL